MVALKVSCDLDRVLDHSRGCWIWWCWLEQSWWHTCISLPSDKLCLLTTSSLYLHPNYLVIGKETLELEELELVIQSGVSTGTGGHVIPHPVNDERLSWICLQTNNGLHFEEELIPVLASIRTRNCCLPPLLVNKVPATFHVTTARITCISLGHFLNYRLIWRTNLNLGCVTSINFRYPLNSDSNIIIISEFCGIQIRIVYRSVNESDRFLSFIHFYLRYRMYAYPGDLITNS